MPNHVERLYAAVSVLAGHGDIKQRLISAFDQHISHIEADELPEGIRESFVELTDSMSAYQPLNGEGKICATVRKMSIHDADRCAQHLLDLYSEYLPQAEAANLKRRSDDQQPVVPPFLVSTGNQSA